MNYTIARAWKGETSVILAGGPSLRGFDSKVLLEAKPRPRVITINDSWRLAPFADVCFFVDWHWWQDQQARNMESLDKSLNFHNAIYRKFWVTLASQFSDHPQVHLLRAFIKDGLATDPAALHTGSKANSGCSAINLAYHYGVSKIILLGYDLQCVDGRTHWHDAGRQHPANFKFTLIDFLKSFPGLVKPLKKAGVTVINATPDSALTCWPIQSLEEALRWKVESPSSPLPA